MNSYNLCVLDIIM